MPASNMRIKDYREYIINAIFMAPIWHTPLCIRDDQANAHCYLKKNDIAHYFTTRPLPTKAESGLVATLKVKGHSLWIRHPPASCIEQRPRPLPFMVYTAQHRVIICMSPLPARAGSDLLQYNL